MLTPKLCKPNSKVKQIVVASLYYTKATIRSVFVDHITEAYSILMAKFGPNLHFALCGDLNRLNINPILRISPNLKQLITVPTRKNSDAILDKIISTLEHYYLPPYTIPPLNNDSENGKPSDHLTVIFKPQHSMEDGKRNYKSIKIRPLTDSGMLQFGDWIRCQDWTNIFKQENAQSMKTDYFVFICNSKIKTVNSIPILPYFDTII